MTVELISGKTRIESRDFLVGWTLREIKAEFEAANISCDREFKPEVSGERRSFVEQHYRTLDLTKPADARRLIAAFASIIERTDRNLPTVPARDQVERSIAQLKACLAKDGLAYDNGNITAVTPESRRIFEGQRGAVTLPNPPHADDVLSDEYVREMWDKCDSRLASSDLEGAVTAARTLLEAILYELESRLAGARGNYKGDLPKQFKQVTKLLRLDEQRPDLDDRFKDVIRGLVMVVNGLAPLRNKMSDGHARERKPALHHARVAVNASKTIAAFLVESYLYQRNKGLLSAHSKAAGVAT